MFTYTIQTPQRLSSPEEFGQIVIKANDDGSSLKLKDVAMQLNLEVQHMICLQN